MWQVAIAFLPIALWHDYDKRFTAHPIKGVGGEVEDHSKASGLELR
ncbi:MAG: hypothetical protein II040_01340 [Muribaculaceae bacterium]|nr:hypothetical protein [Muribaculaceae bacterium]